MQPLLLTTKLYIPPPRPGLVARPHLIARLNEGRRLGHRLTLISAPAGFGKSTLLSEWAGQCKGPVAWLSLDEGDNNDVCFWTYIVTALQKVYPSTADVAFGQAALDLLQLPSMPPVRLVLTLLLNELANLPASIVPDGIVLILDDYHVIHTLAIHEGLTFLLNHQPPQLHLALATRADPPMPLARLRARRHLTVMRANDLRFTTAETATLLNEMLHLAITPDDITALERRTEGWIVGLQLAALALHNRGDAHAFVQTFSGSHHYVLEYLTEEVMHQQPEDVQRFLLQTSILEQLCGPLCDAVLRGKEGEPGETKEAMPASNSLEMLKRLEAANLFITPLDDARHWYRYHHLFADLLHNLLRQTLTPKAIQELHRRASVWYAAQGETHAAINHAVQAQDWTQAAELMERTFAATVSSGNVKALLRWSNALPESVIQARPRLCMYRGWAMFLNGQYGQAEQALHRAEEALCTQRSNRIPSEASSMSEVERSNALRGELAAFLATIATIHHDVSEALKQAHLALRHLPKEALAARARALRALGIAYGLQSETDKLIDVCQEAKALALDAGSLFLASEVMSQIAFMHVHKGQLRQAAQGYQAILDLVPRPQTFPPAGLGYIGLALVTLEWNDLETVEAYLEQGIRLSRQGGIGYMLRTAFCVQAIHRQASGDDDGALAAMRAAHRLPWMPGVSDVPVQLLQYRVRLHLLRGEIDAAARWATGAAFEKTVALDTLPAVLDEIVQHARARVALAQGDMARVLAICDAVIPPAKAAGRMARVIELALLKAIALYAQKQPEAALEILARCLTLAKPASYVRLFIEARPPLPALLRLAITRDIQPKYGRTLLRLLDEPIAVSPSLSPLVDPLTPREREVLRLIGKGLSNQAIADTLVVSLNTVKKHSSHIYSKLGVRNRTQAVARAQALGLL